MKTPKIISKNGHEYIFVKKCNDNVFLYRDMLYGYNECFSRHELGLIKKQPRVFNISPEKIKR